MQNQSEGNVMKILNFHFHEAFKSGYFSISPVVDCSCFENSHLRNNTATSSPKMYFQEALILFGEVSLGYSNIIPPLEGVAIQNRKFGCDIPLSVV